MKKYISLLLVCLFLMTALSASAEQFTIRNGIHFGDSKAELKEKESFLGPLLAVGNFPAGLQTTIRIDNNLCNLYYYLKDDKLSGVLFNFEKAGSPNEPEKNEKAIDLFHLLYVNITAQYGACAEMYAEAADDGIFTGIAWQRQLDQEYNRNRIPFEPIMTYHYIWYVDSDEPDGTTQTVKIDLVFAAYIDTVYPHESPARDPFVFNWVDLSYTPVPVENPFTYSDVRDQL